MGLRGLFPAAIAAIGLGCAADSSGPAHAPVFGSPPVAALDTHPVHRETIGVSVRGRPIGVVRLGSGPDVVLVLASIHGSEGAGTPLVESLIDHLARDPGLLAGRTVVVVARANPDGLAEGTRFNARGVDLNRNYPSGNYSPQRRHGAGPLSEPETRAILGLLERDRPARIVSIHQPLGCIDYDGPGRALAGAMAAAGGLPVRKLGARPGSLGAYAGETLGIPIVTMELPAGASGLPDAALWNRYGPMLLAAVAFR